MVVAASIVDDKDALLEAESMEEEHDDEIGIAAVVVIALSLAHSSLECAQQASSLLFFFALK